MKIRTQTAISEYQAGKQIANLCYYSAPYLTGWNETFFREVVFQGLQDIQAMFPDCGNITAQAAEPVFVSIKVVIN